MKWFKRIVQILCLGMLAAIWVPSFMGFKQAAYYEPQAAEAMPDFAFPEEPERPAEAYRMAMPPPVASADTAAYVPRTIDRDASYSYERERMLWQQQMDSVREAQQRWFDEQSAAIAAASAPPSSFANSANEWLTLICSLISIITFVSQAREWRRKKEA